jgi:hypothetical protein
MFLEVIDDVVPEHLQDFYELTTLGKTKKEDEVLFPLIDFRVKYEITAEEHNIIPISFVHILKSSSSTSSYLDNFALIPEIICSKFNWLLLDIIKARIYLSLPYNTKLDHWSPHNDLPFEHTVVIYYINDSDGDTVFFDRHGKITDKVTPKRGRVCVFDGSILHGAGIPKTGPRLIANFDILNKKTIR